jgi:hypothetical protein
MSWPAEFFADLVVVVEERCGFFRGVLEGDREDLQCLFRVGEGGFVPLLFDWTTSRIVSSVRSTRSTPFPSGSDADARPAEGDDGAGTG